MQSLGYVSMDEANCSALMNACVRGSWDSWDFEGNSGGTSSRTLLIVSDNF